ncbi:YybH family protein [Pseudomonas ovata]|uniref:YybH family protein n=1 Tax=Pseudomonas ovata TaxID=1839709 RepID=UPI000D696B0E|nr:DUF4440 domain-containing protein [Pseudomonas ovata]
MSLKDQLQQAEHALADALATRNSQVVANLYTADARFLPDGGPTLKGRAEIAGFFDTLFKHGIVGGMFTTLEVDDHDHTASEIGEYQLFSESPQGQRLTAAAGRYLVIWKRIDTVWKLHRDVVSRK